MARQGGQGGQGGGVYYETVVVILVLVGLGKELEARARGRAASAIKSLMTLQPPQVTLVDGGVDREVSLNQVRIGDVIRVRPGQRVAVDGVVIQGQTSLDGSLVTGESMPVACQTGDQLYSGMLNLDGALLMRAQRTGGQSFLARVIQQVRQAQSSKADIQRLADRVAGVFVPGVIALALMTVAGWIIVGWADGSSRAIQAGLEAGVAVLLVACPCALGLAVPMAVMVGTGLGASRGILIKDARALERAGKLTDVMLDKTGTLTLGQPKVVAAVSLPQTIYPTDLWTRWAALAERSSEHPLGRAIAQLDPSAESSDRTREFENMVGRGVTARIDDHRIHVGQSDWFASLNVTFTQGLMGLADDAAKRGRTPVAVAVDGQAVGLLELADEIKPQAKAAVQQLHARGLTLWLVTGDRAAVADAVAGELGIDRVIASAMPETKLAQVRLLQSQGRMVAMVGDGVNDAAALAASDLGIAMARTHQPTQTTAGVDAALDAGHLVILGGDVARIPLAIELSQAVLKRIRMGLFWAFFYNLILIPLAMAGRLDPMLAAGAMAFSSLSVVGNALWLYRWKFRSAGSAGEEPGFSSASGNTSSHQRP